MSYHENAIWIIFLVIAGCLAAAVVEAADSSQSASADELSTTVKKLVRQLDAPRLAEREKAEADLLGLGPEAVELLPEAGPRTSAETKERLGRIRRKLEEAAAQSAAAAATVTFHGEGVPLSKFLEEVERQTGNKIVDRREKFGQEKTDPALKIDLDKVPFWEALDRVLDQAGMTVYPYATEPAVSFVARPENAVRGGHTVYPGPFRIEPTAVIATRELNDLEEGSLQVKLQVSWEPRLRPISLRQQFADLKAADENGRPLSVNGSGGELEAQVDRDDTTVEMYLPFALPSRDVKKIASLDGAIDVILPGKAAEFRFDKLTASKMVEKRVGGVTVIFEEARRSEDVWEIAVSVRFDKAGSALESHRGWIFNNEAYLETPEGKKIKDDGFETTQQTENQIGLTYLFNLDTPPDKMTFVYKTPTAILPARFEYRLKEISLP